MLRVRGRKHGYSSHSAKCQKQIISSLWSFSVCNKAFSQRLACSCFLLQIDGAGHLEVINGLQVLDPYMNVDRDGSNVRSSLEVATIFWQVKVAKLRGGHGIWFMLSQRLVSSLYIAH
jgi:hypothetical protein